MKPSYKVVASTIGVLGGIGLAYWYYKQISQDIKPQVQYIKQRYHLRRGRKEYLFLINNKKQWLYQDRIYWHFVHNNKLCNPTLCLMISSMIRNINS